MIPLELRALPSVIAQGGRYVPLLIKFELVRRYDTKIQHLNLYHAKFTRRYPRELHEFFANRGLAPELLVVKQLPGGSFALAGKKINIVDLRKIKSLPELET
jgi:hypothetical protein